MQVRVPYSPKYLPATPQQKIHVYIYSNVVGDVAQSVEHRSGTPPTSIPRCGKEFLPPPPQINFPCRLSYGACTPPCAVAYIYIYAHVKDPVTHFRVRWIMDTLRHPACTAGWVSRLCRSWLSPEEGNPNFPWEKSHWDNTVAKKQKKKKKKAT